MAKLTDAQIGTLTRGARQVNGFISPAPKTPAPMAAQAAHKLAALGLVQEAPCFHDEPWYYGDDESGERVGFRLTAAGFEALGIDPSEWPAYCTQDPDADAEPNGSVEFGQPEADACGIEGGVPAGKPITEADQPLVSAADLAASMKAAETAAIGISELTPESHPIAAANAASWSHLTGKPSLRDAAAAVLAVWDAEVQAGKGFSPALAEAVNRMRLQMPAAKAPKAAGEAGVPKPGSKLEQVINLLSRKGGALAAEVEEATGWNNTSTRGFISSLKIKRGLAVATRKENGTTRYWIGAENAPEALPAAAPKAAKAEGQPAF